MAKRASAKKATAEPAPSFLDDAPATREVASEPQRKTHVVKSWPQFFEAVASGHKLAELRRDDRGYQVGDDMILQEFKPGSAADCGYTGREVRMRITHVMRRDGASEMGSLANPTYAIPPGWCVLSIELAEAPSVLVRALDRLVSKVHEAVHEKAFDGAFMPEVEAALILARAALGVVKR